MRGVAFVLGMLLTMLSGYIAGVGVDSTRLLELHAARGGGDVRGFEPMSIWYGGMLEPVTVTERRMRAPIFVTGVAKDTMQCRQPRIATGAAAGSLM